MKATFTANRLELSRAMMRLSNTIRTKSFKPILQNVKVSVNGHVRLSGTDCEQAHIEEISTTDRHGESEFLLPFGQLKKLVQGSKSKTITLSITDDSATIGAAHLPIGGSIDEYPAIVASGDVVSDYVSDASTFVEIFEKTVFACDVECSRYALGGCKVELDFGASQGINVVATDGRRLSWAYDGLEVDKQDYNWAIVPQRAILTAIKAAKSKIASSVVIRLMQPVVYNHPRRNDATTPIADNRMPRDSVPYIEFVVLDNVGNILTSISTRTVEGRFPAWRDIVRNDLQHIADIQADSLADAMSQVKSIAENEHGTNFTWNALDRDCLVDYRHKSSSVSVFLDTYVYDESMSHCATLDWRYVIDVCKACNGANLSIQGKPAEDDGKVNFAIQILCVNSVHVIMPLARSK